MHGVQDNGHTIWTRLKKRGHLLLHAKYIQVIILVDLHVGVGHGSVGMGATHGRVKFLEILHGAIHPKKLRIGQNIFS